MTNKHGGTCLAGEATLLASTTIYLDAPNCIATLIFNEKL